MQTFNKLDTSVDDASEKNIFMTTSTKLFKQDLYLSNDAIRKTFNFAYEMAPEFHREYRTGGTHERKPNEIFVNTFTGKLSEFALFELLPKYGIVANAPDLEIYPRNKWDTEDLVITSRNDVIYQLNVKSTKHFGHLMLLEQGDYDETGVYTPDNSKSDFYFLVRIQFDLEKKLKSMRKLYDDDLMDKKKLQKLINEVILEVPLQNKDLDKKNTHIFYDVPGYITHRDLIHIINNDYLIQKGDYLRTTQMDASNYYVQSGDFRSLESIIKYQ